ncbi:MAG TPA: carbohydrate ABC transporter permease [Caldilineaceae bacterium]|nr:carbohydrate ABC transporter permease [Caldilineaceae bacterium]
MSVQASPSTVQTAEAGRSVGARRVRRLTFGGLVVSALKYAFLLLMSFSFVLPLLWMVTSAMKDDSQVYTVPPVWFPNPAYPINFINAWNTYNFNLYAFNTVFRYALPVTIGATLSSAIVAYGFSRIRWKGRDFFFYLCLATMMIPFQVTMVPLFIIWKNLGLVDTYFPLILPAYFGTPYFIFMLRQFFMTIPQELSEAARIDGANEFVTMWRVILPLTKPALTVVALFTFLNAWNDYLGPLIYLRQDEQYVLALGLENLRRTVISIGVSALAYPYLMAVSSVITLPILVAFFLAQRTFIEGISLTGIKG